MENFKDEYIKNGISTFKYTWLLRIKKQLEEKIIYKKPIQIPLDNILDKKVKEFFENFSKQNDTIISKLIKL